MLDLNNKTVTIIGAQRSGRSAAKLVCQHGGCAKISHRQSNQSIPFEDYLWLRQHQVRFEEFEHTSKFIEHSDYVVISPGVPAGADVIKWAHEKNIPVLGEIEFASQFCEIPIIAVTGSNGKTTVVTLIHETLKQAGFRSYLCGNVGHPFSEYGLSSSKYDFVVLEVSSFQMESLLDKADAARTSGAIRGFNPHIGVLLNFSENHLDRHKDLDEYFQAKTRLFYNQTNSEYAVLNESNARIRDFSTKISSQVVFFNTYGSKAKSDTINPNFLAILDVLRILRIDESVFQQVLKDFKGVEHRLEFVRSIAGVDYVNDSKSTTAEAGRWALSQTTAPIVLICGGRDKNIDFSVLAELVGHRVKHMLVIGEASKKLCATFQDVVAVQSCDSLKSAVESARGLARSGDQVVFSPMCASFDMFKNFEERGQCFKDIVNEIRVETHA